MAAKPVPITPHVLKWALQDSAVAVEPVATYCHVDPEDVEAWIAGTSQPGTTAFRRLAKFLNRPTSFFFLLEPPDTEVPASFRSPPGGEHVAGVSRDEAKAVRTARRTQRIVGGLRDRLDESMLVLPEASSDVSPEVAAEEARELLRWSVYDQLDARSKTAATKAFRLRLEQVGIVVLHFPLGETKHRGFSLYDPRAAVIAANTNYNAQARSFTYAHELGHLVRRSDSFCGFDADAGIERWCEAFAAAFLLPGPVLRDYVTAKLSGRVSTLAEIKRVANHFNVSQSASAIRLSALGLGPAHLYSLIDKNKDYAKTTGGPATGGLSTPELRLLSLGRSYAELLLSAEEAGKVRRHDVLTYLDVTNTQLSSVRTLLTSELSVED